MDRIEWVPVQSSAIRRVGYDDRHRILYIEWFHGNESATYAYFAVPASDFIGLVQAPSVGTYANQVIKPNYREERYC